MLCESCGIEMRITGSKIVVTGDNSPDETTTVKRVQTLKCINPNCPQPKETEVSHTLLSGSSQS